MEHYYWNDWYTGWGWFLWYALIILMFSSVGNWGYTYRVHRRYGEGSGKGALHILNERYARADIDREEYFKIKSEILADHRHQNKPPARFNQKSPAV
jgi:putative membrane protein